MAANWEKILLTYLHDPPDKALSIRGHVDRARHYAVIAVSEEGSRSLKEAAATADPLASTVERFPMPTAGSKGERAVAPKNSQLRIFHPLSAASKHLDVPPLDDALMQAEQQQLQAIVGGLPANEYRMRLLAIWRRWPDALATNVHPCFALLPADLWLHNTQGLHGQVSLPPTELRMTPSLPHRFPALVPWGKDGTAAQKLAKRCRQAADAAVTAPG